MEALGLGEFVRVTVVHRVHVFCIVHAAEHSGARRLGCNELNTTDRLGRE
jgi:Zn-dependent alcohol dehydrogenase